jgi:hypothetical protein
MPSPGDVVLVQFPGARGARAKSRPALVLAELPGVYQDRLLAGISTRQVGLVGSWDEALSPEEEWFAATGLSAPSYVRMSFLESAADDELRRIGAIPKPLATRLRERLSMWLMESRSP